MALLGLVLVQCDRKSPAEEEQDQRDPLTGLTPTEAREVLARVGDRKITLGEYAGSLARMERFERLRYQTPERQKQLLDEMIEIELLAQEAQRRGLHEDPEVQLRIQQAARDELLAQLKRQQPAPEDLSEREVKEYFDKHKDQFHEPERRRVLVIVMGQEKLAETAAKKARGASGTEWGQLAAKYSLERHNLGKQDAQELAGDLGFVSAPGQERGSNPEVPEPVREAVFDLEKLGDVAPAPVKVGDRYYVVRLGGISPARERSLTDADRLIRVELLRQKYLQAEKRLERELRERFPVEIDQRMVDEMAKQAAGEPSEENEP